jgi:phosphoketolase
MKMHQLMAGALDQAEPDVVMACCGDVPTLETLASGSRRWPWARCRCF